jgi:hypothetical protein
MPLMDLILKNWKAQQSCLFPIFINYIDVTFLYKNCFHIEDHISHTRLDLINLL